MAVVEWDKKSRGSTPPSIKDGGLEVMAYRINVTLPFAKTALPVKSVPFTIHTNVDVP